MNLFLLVCSVRTRFQNHLVGYSYDAAGNLLNDGAGHSFTYDAEGRAITETGGNNGTYVYDAAGHVVRRSIGATTLDFVLDLNGKPVTELDNGTWGRSELYASGAHVATYASSTTYFFHSDWLGSLRAETKVDGTLAGSMTNLPYGDGQVWTGTLPTWSNFAGGDVDNASGLDLFMFRQYTPKTGRWMTPDPAGLSAVDPADPQTWNRYAYVRNSPLALIDPWGLFIGNPCTINPDSCSGGGGGGGKGAKQPESPPGGGHGGGGGNPAKNSCDGPNPPSPCSPANNGNCTASTGSTSIATGNATTNAPTIAAGAAIGEFIGGPPGAFLGGILGSMFGVGGTASYVPSTKSLYAGPTVVFAPALMGGSGVSGTVSSVPASQNPNSIASSWDFSITFQPNPILGSTVVKSPGSGPPVVGPSVGTRVPVSFGISYSFPVKKGGC